MSNNNDNGTPKTLAQRLADRKARARKAAHENAIADRKYVSQTNRKTRKRK
jgi:hypothetical protein